MTSEAALVTVGEFYETSCAVGCAQTFIELVQMFVRLSRIDGRLAFAVIAENFEVDYRCFLVALARGEVAILRPPHSDRLEIDFRPDLN